MVHPPGHQRAAAVKPLHLPPMVHPPGRQRAAAVKPLHLPTTAHLLGRQQSGGLSRLEGKEVAAQKTQLPRSEAGSRPAAGEATTARAEGLAPIADGKRSRTRQDGLQGNVLDMGAITKDLCGSAWIGPCGTGNGEYQRPERLVWVSMDRVLRYRKR